MVKEILDIEVLDAEKRRVPSKHYVYVILVTWSDGTALTVFRRYSRFFDLQTKLLDSFPIEGGVLDPQKRIIPFLPGKIFFGRSHIKDVAMKRLKDINEYCKSLIGLPKHISQCEDVLEFFEVEPDDLDPPTAADDSKLKNLKERKAEKISKPKRLECYVAVAEYTVQASGEMALQPGMRVEVQEKSDIGWWFVNSEDEKGWVPSCYLEPESGTNEDEMQGTMVAPGQEENFICIETFTADSSDEVSLEKGSVVQVLQKKMDGWWFVRYQGKEAYAPATYLKKANNVHTASMVEKSRLSGVEIISSLQDVSNLLNQEAKTESERTKSPVPKASPKSSPRPQSKVAKPGPPSAIFKQRSLERGGSLIPPPRQSTIRKSEKPPSANKSSIYVTVDDFTDTVGDGLSFEKGEKVYVTEKNPAGWWFVKIGDQEGWVPASYLEPYTGNLNTQSVYELASGHQESDDSSDKEDDNDDDEWYAEPDELSVGPQIISVSGPKDDDMAKRPLPPLPPEGNKPCFSKSEGAVKPPPPAPPVKKAETTPNLPSFPPQQSRMEKPWDKPKPTVGKINLPSEASESKGRVSTSGPQDLAAVLKAKFESRSGAAGDSGNSSEEDVVKPKAPASKPFVPPVLPKKPSDVKNDQTLPSTNFGDRKTFLKPAPPAKSKSSKIIIPSKLGGANGSPQLTPKPGLAPPLSKPEQNNNKTTEQNVTPSGTVKSRTAAFNKPATAEKPKPLKPSLPGKPKPAVTSKPNLPGKPSVPAEKRSSQAVSKLASSLGAKLNLGQIPPKVTSNASPANENSDNQNNVPPAPLAPVSLPTKPSTPLAPAASVSKSYVAICDFVAEGDGELGFNEGDEVEMVEEQGDWCLIRFWDEEGWAPSNYLKKV